MRRQIAALTFLLFLAACDTSDPNNLMMFPGPWISQKSPNNWEVVVRDLWGTRKVTSALFEEVHLKALREAALVARNAGSKRFVVLSSHQRIIRQSRGMRPDLRWPVVTLHVLVLKENEAPPEGLKVNSVDETLKMIEEKLE